MLSLFLLPVSAFTAPCPDLSGSYRELRDDGTTADATLAQTGCEKLAITRKVESPSIPGTGLIDITEEWIADGVCRTAFVDPGQTDRFCVSSVFTEAGLAGEIFDRGVPGPVQPLLSGRLTMSLDARGNLVVDVVTLDPFGQETARQTTTAERL